MNTTETVAATDTEQILGVLTDMHAAIRAGDAARALANCAPGAVVFDLAPPLVQRAGGHDDAVAAMAAWIATFPEPPLLAHREPTVHVEGDLAFVHTLTSLTATQGDEFTLWFRTTVGLRRTGGQWLIVHQHESVPFHMDGSFRAAVELLP